MVRRIFSFVVDEGITLRKISKTLHETGIAPRKRKGAYGPSTTLSELRERRRTREGHFGATYMWFRKKY